MSGSDVTNNYDDTVQSGTNNYILQQVDDSYTGPVPSDGPQIDVDSDINARMFKQTFEKLYQNLASYPFNTKVNGDIITRVYTMENNRSYTVKIDGTNENDIIIEITGDNGHDGTLIKRIRVKTEEDIDITYTLESS